MRAETSFLLLRERLGDPGFSRLVWAAYVFPKFAIDAAYAAQLPAGVRELLD
jgi:hypothetical protein